MNEQNRWVTIKDLAKIADVSVSTVSRALADNPRIARETRDKIQQLARETGFSINQTASSLRSRHSSVISVIIALLHETDQHLDDPFMMTMLANLADALADLGYDMLLRKVQAYEDGWIEKVRRGQRPAGIILIGQSSLHEEIDRAVHGGAPIIAWGAKIPGQHYVTVGSDNAAGGHSAVRHLLAQGYSRIAFLGDRSLPEVAQRYAGYRAALAEQGIAADEALYERSGFRADHALDAVQRLLARKVDFDAIVAASDVIAITAIHALIASGRSIPGDVGVVGFDDIQLARYNSPPVTSVAQDIAAGARHLADGVTAMIAGREVASIEMPCRLVVRQSSGAKR
jgi:DNA-binding LacI/PurR family transcriptional regulator